MRYWVWTEEKAKGPFSAEELCRLPGIGPKTLVRSDDSLLATDWVPLEKLPALLAFVRESWVRSVPPAPVRIGLSLANGQGDGAGGVLRVIAAGLLVGVLGLFLVAVERPKASKARPLQVSIPVTPAYGRIKFEMSKAQVLAILGEPQIVMGARSADPTERWLYGARKAREGGMSFGYRDVTYAVEFQVDFIGEQVMATKADAVVVLSEKAN